MSIDEIARAMRRTAVRRCDSAWEPAVMLDWFERDHERSKRSVEWLMAHVDPDAEERPDGMLAAPAPKAPSPRRHKSHTLWKDILAIRKDEVRELTPLLRLP